MGILGNCNGKRKIVCDGKTVMIETGINDSVIVYDNISGQKINDLDGIIIYNDGLHYHIDKRCTIKENLANIYNRTIPFKVIELMSDEMKKYDTVYKMVTTKDTIPVGYYNEGGMIMTSDYNKWRRIPICITESSNVEIDTILGKACIEGFNFVLQNEIFLISLKVDSLDLNLKFIIADYKTAKLNAAVQKFLPRYPDCNNYIEAEFDREVDEYLEKYIKNPNYGKMFDVIKDDGKYLKEVDF